MFACRLLGGLLLAALWYGKLVVRGKGEQWVRWKGMLMLLSPARLVNQQTILQYSLFPSNTFAHVVP